MKLALFSDRSISYAVMFVGVLTCSAAAANTPEIVDEWRYTFRNPPKAWTTPQFDDSGWKQGFGGFGTHNTPGVRIGTTWSTNSIWLRKSIKLASLPAKPAFLIHHDEDATIFLNGKQVARFERWTQDYKVVPMDEKARAQLRVGENLLAVRCRQQSGGQFIDVHIVDADNVPTLPEPKYDPTPFQTALTTIWGQQVTPENAWQEYPRPQMRRKVWQNLNGQWNYAITADTQRNVPVEWAGQILVPFCLESKLGGVQRLLGVHEALWYHRTFNVTASADMHTLLNFEAVDYRCEVYVNGQKVGAHQGGNTPFTLDITSAVKAGENKLIVRVEDETEGWQLNGKQVLNPRGVWYTRVSGIWQTVWLEQVPRTHLSGLKISTDAAAGSITLEPVIANSADGIAVQVMARDAGTVVAEQRSAAKRITLEIPEAKLWSPAAPHLYDLEVALVDAQGQVIDRVKSYAGLRDLGIAKDANGHLRFTLNGEEIFHWGTLDQGWWPDGLLTPPSDAAMTYEIKYLKAAGFNMIRKHIKVEPRRYYYHCDRLGMMVWQDQISGGQRPKWSRLKPDPVDAPWPAEHHKQFMFEFERMITALENHPSIVMWVAFNEAWGQHKSLDVGKWVVARDPSRHLNIASGGNFWPVGHVVDAHKYPHPAFPFDQGAGGRFDDYVKVIGEFGGHGYPVQSHLWDVDRNNWGYGGLPKDEAEYRQRYVTSLEKLNELRAQGIAAGVYTQTTDVEGEINGLMTYDRRVIKIPASELAELHKVLFTDTAKSAVTAHR